MLHRLTKLTEKQKILLVLGVFALLIAAFYGNTLFNDFTHDDIGQVVQNEYIQSLQHAPRVLTGCIWEFALGGCNTYYRPFQSFSYLVTYQFSSHPGLFHAVNLLYFFIAASLVFFLVRRMTRDSLLAFLTGVIFLIHPINSEVVNWVSAVPELGMAIFILATLLAYIRYQESFSRKRKRDEGFPSMKEIFAQLKKKARNVHRPSSLSMSSLRGAFSRRKLFQFGPPRRRRQVEAGRFTSRDRSLALVALFYLLALFSKEPAVLLPILFLFLDVFMFRIPLRSFFSVREMKRYWILLGTLLVYMGLRVFALGGVGVGGYYYSFSLAERTHAFFTLLGQYLIKLVAPYPLLFFYPFEKQSDFSSIQFLGLAAVAVVFLAAIIFLLKKGQWFFVLPLVWIILFLSPVLISLERVGDNIFSERYLFTSSIGAAMIIATGLVYLLRHGRKELRVAGVVLIIIIIGTSWFVVFSRNTVFKNDFTLYTSTIAANPAAHSIRRNLAVELNEEGKYDEAIGHLEEILERDPQWRDIGKVYNNLGDVYHNMGNLERALDYYYAFGQVTEGRNYKAYNNIGSVFMEQEKYLEALPYLCSAVQVEPQAPEPQYNFDRLAIIFDSIENEGILQVYNDLLKGEIFKKGTGSPIQHKETECEDDRCLHFFSTELGPGDILLPFLIMGSVEGSIFRPSERLFNPPTGEILLETSASNKGKNITFVFPMCRGVYYEVATQKVSEKVIQF